MSEKRRRPESPAAAKRREQQAHFDELREAGVEPLTCRVCGFQSYMSIVKHITCKHKTTTAEYLETYPGETLQRGCRTTNETASIAQKKRLEDPDEKARFDAWRRPPPSSVGHWLGKGFDEAESIAKVAEFQGRVSRLRSHESRSESSKGDANPMSLASIAAREGVTPENAKKLTPGYGRTGDKHPMTGKHHAQEALEKIANAWHLKSPSWTSKGEQEVARFCRSLDDVAQNIKMSRYNCDVVFKNVKLVIEFFGTLWHMSPRKFVADQYHYLTRRTASQAWARDARKLVYLASQGYDVVIVWEEDWNRNRAECEKRIKRAYDRFR